ncbi:MAG: hypothetical protein IT383_12890 [Deltaproteobacteria bacterium]|nr:hypothetical protein [Deltaproteobacteria bacterium]
MARTWIALTIVTAVIATSARADDKKPVDAKGAPVTPVPPPAVAAQLSALEGNWRCVGKEHASAMGPERAFKATIVSKIELGGFWLTFRLAEETSSARPAAYNNLAIMGSDGKDGLRRSGVDSMGASLQGTSKGWSGDKLVWDGELAIGPQKVVFRETLTRKGATELSSLVEVQVAPGKWATASEVACKK